MSRLSGSLYLHYLMTMVVGVRPGLQRQHPLGMKSLKGSGRRLLASLKTLSGFNMKDDYQL